jgi:hypothetical protein
MKKYIEKLLIITKIQKINRIVRSRQLRIIYIFWTGRL